jgi:hypothetical protein
MERIDNDPTRAGGISTMTEVPTQKIPLKKRALPKQEGKKLWKTLIVNDHPEVLVHVPSPPNYIQRWADISPKEELVLEFDDTSYFLMPYRKIVYGRKDNNVSLQKRKGYVEHKRSGYSCTFLNKASHIFLEVFPSEDNRGPIYLPLGIPVVRSFPASSRWAEYASVTFEAPLIVEVMDTGRPGCTKLELQPNVIKKKHPKRILDRIHEERKAGALRSAGLRK